MSLKHIIAGLMATTAVVVAVETDVFAQEGSKETTKTEKSSENSWVNTSEEYIKRFPSLIHMNRHGGNMLCFDDLAMQINNGQPSLKGSVDGLEFLMIKVGEDICTVTHHKEDKTDVYNKHVTRDSNIPDKRLQIIREKLMNDNVIKSVMKEHDAIIGILRKFDLGRYSTILDGFATAECYSGLTNRDNLIYIPPFSPLRGTDLPAKLIFRNFNFNIYPELKQSGFIKKLEHHPDDGNKPTLSFHSIGFKVSGCGDKKRYVFEIESPAYKMRNVRYTLNPDGKTHVNFWLPQMEKDRRDGIGVTARFNKMDLIEEINAVRYMGKNKRQLERVNAFNIKRLYDAGRPQLGQMIRALDGR